MKLHQSVLGAYLCVLCSLSQETHVTNDDYILNCAIWWKCDPINKLPCIFFAYWANRFSFFVSITAAFQKKRYSLTLLLGDHKYSQYSIQRSISANLCFLNANKVVFFLLFHKAFFSSSSRPFSLLQFAHSFFVICTHINLIWASQWERKDNNGEISESFEAAQSRFGVLKCVRW